MPATKRNSGVFSPVIMPFRRNLEVDAERLIHQCRWLLSQQVGIAVFGTNSEANSLSVEEKIDLLDRLVEAGIDPLRLLPGTGLCALPDSVKLTRHVADLGCSGALMLPPFYYKGVSDEGLYRSYAEVIERVGSARLRIYLYHIPPVSQIGISIELIERLLANYPDVVVGIKDSSGDWQNTKTMLDAGWDDFRIFAGSESFLLQTMQAGGAGCISATANINPAGIYDLYHNWQSPTAAAAQQELIDLRECVQRFPVIPALKCIVSHYGGDPEWLRVRPPLVELAEGQQRDLIARLDAMGFKMSGLAESV
jgi:4-hydroxy-tetrahydrodipicolinate synthase